MRFNWNDIPERHFKDAHRHAPSGMGPGSAPAAVSIVVPKYGQNGSASHSCVSGIPRVRDTLDR